VHAARRTALSLLLGLSVVAPVTAWAQPSVVADLVASRDARAVHCAVPGLRAPSALAPPPADADLDLALLPGAFGVAENGAVWVTEEAVERRAIAFLAAHLVLVVPRKEIVHNMHEACARLGFDQCGYGTFIAGPSKTADIEQTLVIGAHGPRSLTVLIVGGPEPSANG